MTLGFLKLYNSESVDDKKKALNIIKGMEHELALEVGEGESVVNYLDHDDLAAEVENETLTAKRANEIAAARAKEKLDQTKAEQKTERDENKTRTQELTATGTRQLNEFEDSIKTDPNYAKLRPAFVKLLRPIVNNTHPTKWGEAAAEVWKNMKELAPAGPANDPESDPEAGKPAPQNEPLRPKGGDGGGSGADVEAEAGSALDALNQGIANAAR
jgi:hypothetical protein